jgi:uncharacterized protein YjbJ (UPF0337 family)
VRSNGWTSAPHDRRLVQRGGIVCHGVRLARRAKGKQPWNGSAASAGSVRGKETALSAKDKASNKAQESAGKVKKTVGEATDNRSLEAEGRKDQSAGDLKQAGEKVKDAFKK